MEEGNLSKQYLLYNIRHRTFQGLEPLRFPYCRASMCFTTLRMDAVKPLKNGEFNVCSAKRRYHALTPVLPTVVVLLYVVVLLLL